MAGKASRIVLEQRGVEIARAEHRWKENAERFDARLHYTPPSSGTSTVTLRVLPFEGEAVVTDNAVDLRLAVSERRLNVLVHEPRPSWNAAFVRRALEQDPSFDVSTIVQASKGLAVRAGSPPTALTAAALSPFDVVLIGAPEELRQSEIEALRTVRSNQGRGRRVPSRPPSCRAISRAHSLSQIRPVSQIRRSPRRQRHRHPVDRGRTTACIRNRRVPGKPARRIGAGFDGAFH